MSKRDEEKRKSLADLARIAEKAEATPWLPPRKAAQRAASTAPAKLPPAVPPARPQSEADRARAKRLEERRLKLDEEKRLRERRQSELRKGENLQWRGMAWGDVPTGIRRTPFDRAEPSLHQKLTDVLGETKEKEGRAKSRAKGRRQGGR